MGGSLLLLVFSVRGEEAGLVAEWKEVVPGVSHGSFALTEPRLIRAEVLRVDLTAPGLSLVTTGDNGAQPDETDAVVTSEFLRKEGCVAAVNAAPFSRVYKEPGGPEDVHGLMMREGRVISPADGRPCLAFDRENRGSVHDADHDAAKTAVTAVSGFAVILRDGAVVGRDRNLHPRTGAGVSADGRTLWLLVVDGRQKTWSGGCTTPEMAVWLKRLGADDAINLDGGGTTTMVIAGKDGDEGKVKVVNRPIHLGIPGRERPSGSHLGIRVKPSGR
jgi:hypothetical protein